MQVGYEVGVRTCIHVNPLGRVYASRVHTSGDATPQWEDVLIPSERLFCRVKSGTRIQVYR